MNFQNNRFGKELRLRSKADFFYLRSKSKSKNSKSLKVVYKPSRLDIEQTRLGIVVSKKCGKAVVRNKIKRIIKEFFRCSEYKNLGLDMLVIVHSRYMAEARDNKVNWKERIRTDLQHCFSNILSQTK